MATLLLDVKNATTKAFRDTFSTSLAPEFSADVTRSTQKHFGDYQCNNSMTLAKVLKKSPREIAAQVLPLLQKNSLFESAEIAGPGFINLSINTQHLATLNAKQLTTKHLGVTQCNPTSRVVVDFSSPNIAKEMHVGHLRSTIIGDALANIFEFTGFNVLRLNHVGDWGTSFGMLITYLKDAEPDILTGKKDTNLSHLVNWYKASKKQFDDDPSFKKRAQEQVVSLQSGEPTARKAWEIICQISREAFQEIYDLLNISLIERGESYYNDSLKPLVDDLAQAGHVSISNGAKCLFMPGFIARDDTPLPFIIQKSDGGFNYATTDLAALTQRIKSEKADRIIYVTDSGQALHFNMLFSAAEKIGLLNKHETQLDHVGFGLVLGPDGKKYKTRSGETERLADLLAEAIERAKSILQERYPDWSLENLQHAAEVLGLGALKYADLSGNRIADYQFSYDKMLRFDGNTAAFILYAYVRAKSILRKNRETQLSASEAEISLTEPSERDLSLKLAQLPETIDCILKDLMPNHLTDYLFSLAQTFNAFFRDCRVTGSENMNSRLYLCELTARILRCGLGLLGIKTLEKM